MMMIRGWQVFYSMDFVLPLLLLLLCRCLVLWLEVCMCRYVREIKWWWKSKRRFPSHTHRQTTKTSTNDLWFFRSSFGGHTAAPFTSVMPSLFWSEAPRTGSLQGVQRETRSHASLHRPHHKNLHPLVFIYYNSNASNRHAHLHFILALTAESSPTFTRTHTHRYQRTGTKF